MGVLILHSSFEAASRALIESLGVTLPDGPDVMLSVNGVGVRVVSDHERCVEVNPQFRAYPTLVYTSGARVFTLDTPASWPQCLEFIAAKDAELAGTLPDPAAPRVMSKYAFLNRLTLAELTAAEELLVAGDINLRVADRLMREASDIDLDDPNIQGYVAYLVSKRILTAERATAILA